MAKKEVLQGSAEMMFIERGMTAKAIAELLNVTEKTVGAWRSKGKWDARRDELLASPHKIKELFMKELRSLADGNKATLDSDAISKLIKALAFISDQVNPRLVITVLKMLDEFIADYEPELANKNLEHHKRFILHIINMHG